jgi:hypothetical protein
VGATLRKSPHRGRLDMLTDLPKGGTVQGRITSSAVLVKVALGNVG